jgi:hypothetical protein
MLYAGWALWAFVCVLFLLWFGNYTAGKYAKLYGFVPMPPQIESEPEPQEVRHVARDWGDACTVVGTYSSCIAMPITYNAKISRWQ